MNLKEKIKAEAGRLGFTLIGFTNLEPPQSIQAYLDWIDRGLYAEMEYLARPAAVEKRADPTKIMPQAKSLICLGMRYPSPASTPAPPAVEGPHGRLASYAWGQDYHLVIPPKLEQLAVFIEHELGRRIDRKAYTDTGPILERDLAQRAGLGWIGKNSCLINPSSGSYYLLAELFVDVEFEIDAPFLNDHCGTCTRCIDACPTGCILPNRTLDSRRCISYLTIENKGPVEKELRPKLGEWVFGCDICQQVCPWNIRFAAQPGEPEFSGQTKTARPGLIEELRLTPHEFNQKFKNSPVQRARRRGYLRNIAVALGNSGDEKAVPALAECLLNEPEPLVRTHAAWALGRIQTRSAKAALQKARLKEANREVLDEIEDALRTW